MSYTEDSFGLIRGLQLAKFILKLRVIEKIILPEYKGSTFRGVLGWQLKKIICINRDVADCPECLLSPKCLYNYLFSPPLPPDTQFLHHTSRIPAPIVLDPPLTPDTMEGRLGAHRQRDRVSAIPDICIHRNRERRYRDRVVSTGE